MLPNFDLGRAYGLCECVEYDGARAGRTLVDGEYVFWHVSGYFTANEEFQGTSRNASHIRQRSP
jgi:hypothetical protein